MSAWRYIDGVWSFHWHPADAWLVPLAVVLGVFYYWAETRDQS